MNETMPDLPGAEHAKAVAEIAKTAREVIRSGGALGSWLVKVLGTIPEDFVGRFGGDWLRECRIRNKTVLAAETARKLGAIEPDRITSPSPSVLLPLLEAAQDEDRPELQDVWSTLLARAMLQDYLPRRDYFETVRQLEPTDVLLLDIIYRIRPAAGTDALVTAEAHISAEWKKAGFDQNERYISQAKLISLGCCAIMGLGNLSVTPFGRGLAEACTAPKPTAIEVE